MPPPGEAGTAGKTSSPRWIGRSRGRLPQSPQVYCRCRWFDELDQNILWYRNITWDRDQSENGDLYCGQCHLKIHWEKDQAIDRRIGRQREVEETRIRKLPLVKIWDLVDRLRIATGWTASGVALEEWEKQLVKAEQWPRVKLIFDRKLKEARGEEASQQQRAEYQQLQFFLTGPAGANPIQRIRASPHGDIGLQ